MLNNVTKMEELRVKDVVIRPIEDKDLTWLKEYDEHISEDVLKRKIDSSEVYIVQIEDKLVGWLRYNLFWDSIPFMNLICILEDYRGKGLGKKLVCFWENEMKEKGYGNVLTSTLLSEDAQHFYRKLCYKDIGGFNYLDEPLEIIFQKEL